MSTIKERILVKLLIGHESEPLEKPTVNGQMFRWTCFIRPITLPNFEGRSFINKVKFKLHESYQQPVRIVKEPPFEVTETAYGSFDINLEIYFNYPGAKPIKYTYDMLIQLEKKSQVTTDVTFELKDAPNSFVDQARKYGVKRKKSGVEDKESLFPPLKIIKSDESRSPREPMKSKKEERLVDAPSKEKEKERVKEKRDKEKEKEKKREKEKPRDKDKEKERWNKDKRREDKGKRKEEKQKHEEKSRIPTPSKLSPLAKLSPDLQQHVLASLRKETPSTSPSVAKQKLSPEIQYKLKRETPSSSPTIVIRTPPKPLTKPTIKHAPSKEERRIPLSDSDTSSPSTSYGSLTPRTPQFLSGPGVLSPSEMQRRISMLTDEEQIFRVAAVLISLPGTNISKASLSFDFDLSSADPSLINRLSEALL